MTRTVIAFLIGVLFTIFAIQWSFLLTKLVYILISISFLIIFLVLIIFFYVNSTVNTNNFRRSIMFLFRFIAILYKDPSKFRSRLIKNRLRSFFLSNKNVIFYSFAFLFSSGYIIAIVTAIMIFVNTSLQQANLDLTRDQIEILNKQSVIENNSVISKTSNEIIERLKHFSGIESKLRQIVISTFHSKYSFYNPNSEIGFSGSGRGILKFNTKTKEIGAFEVDTEMRDSTKLSSINIRTIASKYMKLFYGIPNNKYSKYEEKINSGAVKNFKYKKICDQFFENLYPCKDMLEISNNETDMKKFPKCNIRTETLVQCRERAISYVRGRPYFFLFAAVVSNIEDRNVRLANFQSNELVPLFLGDSSIIPYDLTKCGISIEELEKIASNQEAYIKAHHYNESPIDYITKLLKGLEEWKTIWSQVIKEEKGYFTEINRIFDKDNTIYFDDPSSMKMDLTKNSKHNLSILENIAMKSERAKSDLNYMFGKCTQARQNASRTLSDMKFR